MCSDEQKDQKTEEAFRQEILNIYAEIFIKERDTSGLYEEE